MGQPLFPNVKLDLTSIDGNAFSLIGVSSGKARRAGVPADKIKEFQTEAMSGDYDHVI